MTDKQQLAQYSADLTSTHRDAVAVLDTQPASKRSAVLVMETLGEDLNALAYGTPEQWANMLLSVATRSQDFALALVLAYRELEGFALDGRDNDGDHN